MFRQRARERFADSIMSLCAEGSELDDVANEVFAAAEDDTSEHHVLTQEVEEEAVLWANLKRNFYTNFLLKLLTDAVMVL